MTSSKNQNAFGVRCHFFGEKEKSLYDFVESYFGKENTFLVINSNQKLKIPKVKFMDEMFSYSHFNQPINEWDLSGVESLEGFLKSCAEFNQPLDNLNLDECSNFSKFFSGCKIFY